jgi:hypothetical protein
MRAVFDWLGLVFIASAFFYALTLADRQAVTAMQYRTCNEVTADCDQSCPRGTLLRALCPPHE